MPSTKISFQSVRYLRGFAKRIYDSSVSKQSIEQSLPLEEKTVSNFPSTPTNVNHSLTPLTERDLIQLDQQQKPGTKIDKVTFHESQITLGNKYARDNVPRVKEIRKSLVNINPKGLNESNQAKLLQEAMLPLLKYPYKTQLMMKKQHIMSFLVYMKAKLIEGNAPLISTAKNDFIPFSGVSPSPNIFDYRNKMEFSIHKGVDGNPKTVGMFIGRPKDPNVKCVPADELPNIREEIRFVASHFQKFLDKSEHPACYSLDKGGVWRNITVRVSSTNEIMATVLISPLDLSREQSLAIKSDLEEYFFQGEGSECGITSLYIQESTRVRPDGASSPYQLIAGKSRIQEKLVDTFFEIGPDSNFPVNAGAASLLFRRLHEHVFGDGNTTLLHLNCGTGVYSTMLAPDVRSVIGIDSSPYAIADARANAKINGLTKCNYIVGTPKSVLPKLVDELSDVSNVVVILEGSPDGMTKGLIPAIKGCGAIKTVLYIVNNPHKAQYNLHAFGNSHFTQKKDALVPADVFCVDMIPHTIHQQVVFVLKRNIPK